MLMRELRIVLVKCFFPNWLFLLSHPRLAFNSLSFHDIGVLELASVQKCLVLHLMVSDNLYCLMNNSLISF